MKKELIKELAEKICNLTGYGQALHPNDIIPELQEAYEAGIKEGVQLMFKDEDWKRVLQLAWIKEGDRAEKENEPMYLVNIEYALDTHFVARWNLNRN